MSTTDSQQVCGLQEILEILDCLLEQPSFGLSAEGLPNSDYTYNTSEMQEHVGFEPTYRRHLLTGCAVNSDDGLRPKSFLHDEMFEFNQIFAQLIQPKSNVSSTLDESNRSTSGVSITSHIENHCSNVLNDGLDLCCPASASQIASLPGRNSRHNLLMLETYEDDNDSGYQSGNNTLVASMNKISSVGKSLPCSSNSQQIVTHEFTPMSKSEIDQGFIRIRINLTLPIYMAMDAVNDYPCHSSADVEPFYLPSDTVVVIHITSKMTTVEVIQAILDKYTITDSCDKFALYENTTDNSGISRGQYSRESVRRLGSDEHPLQLWLLWTEDIDSHQFMLKDKMTSEIAWESFSLPELEAFLLILEREETAYVNKITQKFLSLRAAAVQRLKSMCL